MADDSMHELSAIPEDWPVPEAAALDHSRRLSAVLAERIGERDNWLSFHDWMESVLYEPGLGYYSAGARRFGEAGDFVTAPVLSSLFGATLAKQCHQVLRDCHGDTILEFGPGDGDLAVDVLSELDRMGQLPQHYWLLERSADLRERQAQRLGELPKHVRERVDWLERPPEQPFRGVILANEVADALPVERFRRTQHGVQALGVSLDEEARFVTAERPASAQLSQAVDAIEQELGQALPEDYCSEFNPGLRGWMGTLADCLEAGLALVVDYGYPRATYYMPERSQGTLMCHYRHRAHGDALLLPGLQDVTAFVDFTAAAESAFNAGLEVLGFAPQAHFLLGAGLTDVLEARRAEVDEMEATRLAQQAKTLTLPSEMGERFQVLGVGRGLTHQPLGFCLYNHVHRL